MEMRHIVATAAASAALACLGPFAHVDVGWIVGQRRVSALRCRECPTCLFAEPTAPETNLGPDQLGLVEPDLGLGQSIVVGIAHGPDRGVDAGVDESLGERERGVLAAGQAVVEAPRANGLVGIRELGQRRH